LKFSGVVGFLMITLLHITAGCTSEEILKIGQYLLQLQEKLNG